MKLSSAYQNESIRRALANRQRLIARAERKRQRTTWLWVLAVFASACIGALAAAVFGWMGAR